MNHCLIFGLTTWHRSGGGHRIANHLRNQGWDAEVIDYVVFWKLEELKELAKSRINKNTKFFGFSFIYNRVYNDDVIASFMRWVKETYPDIILVSGGHSTLFWKFYDIDYHLIGYGEYALDALLSWLFSNGKRPKFDLGLAKNKHTKVVNALHSYPAYPFEDASIKYDPRDFIQPQEQGNIEFARGCKFKCKFCNFPVLGVKGDSTRSPESVRDQLMFNYDNYGMTDYIITDETFNDRVEKITKFADVVETLPFKPYFASYIRADLLITRKKEREELLRMGVLGQFYGVETFNYETAKYIGKGMHPDKVKAGLIEVKKYFQQHVGKRYRGQISLIGGLPYETKESLESTTQWIRKNWLDQCVGANALDLHNPDDFRVSDVDESYQQLGYRKIEFNRDTYNKIVGPTIDFASNMLEVGDNASIIWENDNMNVYDAIKWAADMHDKVYTVGGINMLKSSPMKLGENYADKNGVLLNTDQKLGLVLEQRNKARDNFQIYLKTYISQKLSI
jgi:Radical SAM superfamily